MGKLFTQYERVKFTDFGTNGKKGCQVKKDLNNGKIIVYHPASFDLEGYAMPHTNYNKIEILELDVKKDEVVRIQ